MKLSKLLKTIGVSTLTAASIITPIATTISCGTAASAGSDLTVGIRSEDQPLWNKVGAEFKKATGKTVKFKWIGDQNNDYTLWHGSDLMPDITIADSGWAKTGHDRNWFQQIDMKDLAENPDYLLLNQDKLDEGYKEDKTLKYDGDHFETAMMATMDTDGDTYNGEAVIYGPKLTYAWKKIPSATKGKYFHLINDGELPAGDTGKPVNLEYYVPDGKGGVVKAVDGSKNEGKSSILYSAKDGHRLQTTIDDIQEFLTRAAAQEDVKFNGLISTDKGITADAFDGVTENSTAAQNLMITTGMKGYNQRMASVSKVLFDKIKASDDKKVKEVVKELQVGAVEDSAFNWGSLAYGTSAQSKEAGNGADEATLKAKWNLNDKNVLLDEKVFTDKQPSADKIDVINKIGQLGTYDLNEYASNLGYFTHGVFGNSSVSKDKEDRQNLFGKVQSLFLGDGALWQWGGISDKIKDTFKGENVESLLTSFGEPYQITGVDGYALKSELTGDRLTLAKQFMRFLMQNKVASEITGDKAVSTVKGAHALQAKPEGARGHGLAAAGISLLDQFENLHPINLPTTLAKSSTTDGKKVNGQDDTPIYDPYNDYYMKASDSIWKLDGEKILPTNGLSTNHGLTLEEFKHSRDALNAKYKADLKF